MKTITIKIYDEYIDMFPGLKDPEGALHDVIMSSYNDPDREGIKESRMAVSVMLTNMHIDDAQPERKTGRWIDMGDFEQCSVCTGTHLKEVNTVYGKAIWIKSAFCPNCGQMNIFSFLDGGKL